MRLLDWAARHGPLVLVSGLVAGLALPGLASVLRPALPGLVLVLLLLALLRAEPANLFGRLPGLAGDALAVLALQLALPLAVLALAQASGLQQAPVVLALVLMTAAPSIMGSPNICMMMGLSPDHAMRLLVLGTAALPLTVLPVFWALPALGGAGPVLAAAGRLLAAIVLTALAAKLLRATLLARPSKARARRIDGASALLLAVFVIGLMPSVSALAAASPATAAFWLAVAVTANFGLQLLVRGLARSRLPPDHLTALSVIAGNRNIALFFLSLPDAVLAPVIAFIGFYQIPMYLTPLVMRRLNRPSMS